MKNNNENTKPQHTPGLVTTEKVESIYLGVTDFLVVESRNKSNIVARFPHYMGFDKGNSQLLSEAINVYNETGKTPLKLEQENKEMLVFLKRVIKREYALSRSGLKSKIQKEAELLIAKAERRGNG